MASRASGRLIETIEAAREYVSSRVIGQEATKRHLFAALIAGGHVLLEGPPGSAKTTLAKSFAYACGGRFRRIQFTPDMLPGDVTGFYLYGLDGSARFVEGPLFGNFVLADELNRTTPRTQAALIEAMQERQVTLEGTTYRLDRPFMVIASQVPAGGLGTFPLIDVQMDRFMFRLESHYATQDEERQMLAVIDALEDSDGDPTLQLEDVLALQAAVKRLFVADAIVTYITEIIQVLRAHVDLAGGPSSRGTIALFKGARAVALLEGRDFVIPDDVKSIAEPALGHRLQLKPEAEADGVDVMEIVRRTLEDVPVPQ